MMSLLNYRLRLTLSDSRVLVGQMLAFDKHMNLVLSDCQEFRQLKNKRVKTTAGTSASEFKRTLGLVVLRGENIVSISVDGPPPASVSEQQQRAKAAQMQQGPGLGRPAGRGIPMVPPPGAPVPPGLAGPVRGVGGPAPQMMMPRGPPPGFAPPPPPGPGFARPPPPGMPGQPPMMPPPGWNPSMRPPPPGMMPPG
ncbi:Small nuclear ribonucleoprotein-associated protein B [Spiromyces aspiralis]|uniref:Small nuclear ribonucleoprotein-associated protein B n=1 Tax=Spiromyces aspiralis TaxID=68401 RepID=A0ACC1HNM5_9FUNG|nr:Small nuclear ribonucleoprotein-associated protein B [Spiromyces aspiralis]